MAPGDVANGVRHGENGEAECERYAEQADTDLREGGSDHRAATAAEGQPECADRFGRELLNVHVPLPKWLPT